MKNQTLQKAIALLATSFPGVDFNTELYWEMMKDLNDEHFLSAVLEFVKTTKNIYPGTNPIAILRELTHEQKERHYRSLPPPPKTQAEIQQIEDMRETYRKLEKKGAEEHKLRLEKRDKEKKQAQEFMKRLRDGGVKWPA